MMEFDEYGIKGWVQNETTLERPKHHGNWLRHFEGVSRLFEESSDVAASFIWPALHGLQLRIDYDVN